MNIIGICGPAGSGKDTAREVLTGCFNVTGMAFADPMRAMLGALLDECNVSREWMVLRDLKEQPMPGLGVSYRHAAQALGTEWGRALTPGNELWVRIAQAKMIDAMLVHGENHVFCISDVRFDNEARWIKEHGGVVWSIERPGVASVRSHASESGVSDDLIDAHLVNADGLVDFQGLVMDHAVSQLAEWGAL
jgi:hypothetical protein